MNDITSDQRTPPKKSRKPIFLGCGLAIMGALLITVILIAIGSYLLVTGAADCYEKEQSSSTSTTSARRHSPPLTTEDSPLSTTETSATPTTVEEESEIRTEQVRVLRIVDGDTIAVEADANRGLPGTDNDPSEHIVRILGIDTPELNARDQEPAECGAEEATAHLGELLTVQDAVLLTFDPGTDETDRFGRSLAYVVTHDDRDIGFTMVTDGYAGAWYPPSEPTPTNYPAYAEAERKATAEGAGAHGKCEGTLGRD